MEWLAFIILHGRVASITAAYPSHVPALVMEVEAEYPAYGEPSLVAGRLVFRLADNFRLAPGHQQTPYKLGRPPHLAGAFRVRDGMNPQRLGNSRRAQCARNGCLSECERSGKLFFYDGRTSGQVLCSVSLGTQNTHTHNKNELWIPSPPY